MVRGFTNSLVIGVFASALILTVCTLAGWIVVHGTGRARHVLDVLTSVPVAIPNIVVGICLLWVYFVVPVNIRGTHLILVLAYFTLFVALAARVINARLLQMDKELVEAAQMCGASYLTTMRTIVAPLILPALASLSLYIVAASFKELETTTLLSSPQTKTASVVLFDSVGGATMSQTAAIGVVSILTLLVVLLGWQVLARKFNIQGF